MTEETRNETRDRSSAATMFGRIALKNKLVDEATLKKVMSELPAGADLGAVLVKQGLISEQHAEAIQKKITEHMKSAPAAGNGASASAATGGGDYGCRCPANGFQRHAWETHPRIPEAGKGVWLF
ncbi:hypothetical protein OAU96_04040 [Planctomycetota bacterium]|nr:hypothetical protein [Planctomycetota bacterium]